MKRLCDFLIKFSLYCLILFVPLFFSPWTAEMFEFNKQYLIFLLTIIALFCWLIKKIFLEGKVSFIFSSLYIWIFAFIVVNIISAELSIDKVSSWIGYYGKFSNSVLCIISLFLLFLVVINNSSRNNGAEKGISICNTLNLFLIAGSIVVSVSYLSLWGVFELIEWLPAVMKIRSFNLVSGTVEGLSIFLVVLISSIIGLLSREAITVTLSSKSEANNDKKWEKGRLQIKKIFLFILLVFSVFLLVIFDFWVSWLVLLATMSLLLAVALWTRIFKEKANVLMIPIFLVIISCIFLVKSSANSKILNNLTPIDSVLHEAVLDYKTASVVVWKAFKENPIVGSGPETFMYNFAKFKPASFNESRFWNIRFDRAPSYWMEIIAATGLVGIIMYSIFVVIFVLITLSLFKYVLASKKKVANLSIKKEIYLDSNVLFIIPLFLSWIALLIAQIFYVQTTVLAFYFWFFTALIIVVWQDLRESLCKRIELSFKKLPELGLIINSLFITVIVIILVYLGYFGGKMYWADVYFAQVQAADTREEIVNKISKAVELNEYRESYRILLSQAYLSLAWEEVKKTKEEINIEVVQGYVMEAIQQAKYCTANKPFSIAAWDNLGKVYRDLRGLVNGDELNGMIEESFKKGLELEPVNPLFYRELCRIGLAGKTAETKDGWDETLTLCQKAIELKSNYLDAHIQLALAYEQKGDLEEAKKQLESVLKKMKGLSFERGSELAGVVAEIYFELGRVEFNLKNKEGAIKMFEQAVIVMPQYANAHFALGLAYEDVNRKEDALVQYKEVERLLPNDENTKNKIKELEEENE